MDASLKDHALRTPPAFEAGGLRQRNLACDPIVRSLLSSWRLVRPRQLFLLMSWCLLAIGIGLRLFQYSFSHSLWLDEALVATNLQQKAYGDLMHELAYDQRAPAGFLLVVKGLAEHLDYSEQALRLFPWLCSLVSLFCFHLLARRLLCPGAAIIGLALTAFSPPLISYAAELKQYGVEVTVTLVLLLAADRVLTGPATRSRMAAALAVAGTVGVWFSFTAPFILLGIGMCLAVAAFYGRIGGSSRSWAWSARHGWRVSPSFMRCSSAFFRKVPI